MFFLSALKATIDMQPEGTVDCHVVRAINSLLEGGNELFMLRAIYQMSHSLNPSSVMSTQLGFGKEDNILDPFVLE